MASPSVSFSALILSVSVLFGSPVWGATERCHPKDKKALLKIKAALLEVDPYGEIPSWNPATDCCRNWFGVKCQPFTHRINNFAFFRQDSPIKIPAAIGDLSYLESITFHKLTNFSGSIPSSITKLMHLSFLTISWVNLTGPVPDFLGQIKSLTQIDLSFNKLTGSIPSSLSQVPNLIYIGLDRNQLTGTIPASFVNLKPNRLSLVLSNNMLSGPIPASLREIDFGHIDLSHNQFQGDISMLFGHNKTTELVFLSRNMFEFNMSNLELPSSLRTLFLDHNKIYGSIPTEMINLQYMTYFNVSYNRLCGEIPQGGNLQSLDYFSYFHNRCLCGAPLNVTCH